MNEQVQVMYQVEGANGVAGYFDDFKSADAFARELKLKVVRYEYKRELISTGVERDYQKKSNAMQEAWRRLDEQEASVERSKVLGPEVTPAEVDLMVGVSESKLREARDKSFEIELDELLNMYNMEDDSDTPDWILGGYIRSCLRAFNLAVKFREKHYGRIKED